LCERQASLQKGACHPETAFAQGHRRQVEECFQDAGSVVPAFGEGQALLIEGARRPKVALCHREIAGPIERPGPEIGVPLDEG
jgi:hypothetical protein